LIRTLADPPEQKNQNNCYLFPSWFPEQNSSNSSGVAGAKFTLSPELCFQNNEWAKANLNRIPRLIPKAKESIGQYSTERLTLCGAIIVFENREYK
jgi:hypothetical protein